jgi:hypothetical protein
VIDAVGDGTMVRDVNEQQALGACVESFQGHVISLSLRGWHLSSSLRTFLARLIVPFSSSELDLRATHGSYPALWPFSTKVWGITTMLFTAYYGAAAPTSPCRASHRRAERANDLLRLDHVK